MEYTACLLCGSTESNVIFRNSRDKYFQKFASLRGHASILVMCARCGFAYHNPKLSREETDRIYRVLYRPQVPNVEFLAGKQEAMRSHLDFFDKHLDLSEGNKRLLDVGCSEGSFLAAFRDRYGWDVYGIEPSETFGQYAREVRGLEVAEAFFDEDVFPALKFDLVSCIAVLEHIHDPIEVLTALRAKMVEGGYLFVMLPNLLKPRGNLRFTLLDSTHLFVFTPRTARRLLAKAGFRVIAMDASRPAHLRAIARVGSFDVVRADAVIDQDMDDYREVQRILRRHQLHWYFTAEWKDQVQRMMRRTFGDSSGQRIVNFLKRCNAVLSRSDHV